MGSWKDFQDQGFPLLREVLLGSTGLLHTDIFMARLQGQETVQSVTLPSAWVQFCPIEEGPLSES